MLQAIDPNVVQMLIYRAGITCVVAYTMWWALRFIKKPDVWHLHGLARLPGVTRFAAGPLRHLLVFVFLASAVCFVLKLAPLAAAAVMCLSFVTIMSIYQSGPWTGYFVVNASGKVERVLFHTTHLAGLCTVGMLVTEIIAAVRQVPRASLAGTDAADNIFLQVIWACIGAHYCTSGLSKLRKQGFRWVDRRLFPYYLTFAKLFAIGDGYNPKENGTNPKERVADILVGRPEIALTLLALTLFLELGGALYPFGSVLRLVFGIGLIGFHIGSRTLLVPFDKNLVILFIASFNHLFIVNWMAQLLTGGGASFTALLENAGNAAGEPLLGAAVLCSMIAVSFLLGERFYPFSVLSMFTSPYRPQKVCMFADATEERILPMPQMIGRTTLGVTRDLSFHIDNGGSLEAFIEGLEERMRQFRGDGVPGRYRVLVKTVDVERRGKISVEEVYLERQVRQQGG